MPDTRTPQRPHARSLLVLAICSLLFTLLSGASVLLSERPLAQSGFASRGESYTIERVVDGDTVEVAQPIQGEDNVRLIGIDTPETFGGEEPLGPEATQFTTERLEGREVALQFDQERVDQYGRPLAYVWSTQNELFNETLVREGLAQVATFPPNVKYEDEFLAAQEEARAACRGIWGLSAEEQSQLADRGNDLGAGPAGCSANNSGEQPSEVNTEPPESSSSPPGQPGSVQPIGAGASPSTPSGQVQPADIPETSGVSLLPLSGAMMTLGFSGLLIVRRLR